MDSKQRAQTKEMKHSIPNFTLFRGWNLIFLWAVVLDTKGRSGDHSWLLT